MIYCLIKICYTVNTQFGEALFTEFGQAYRSDVLSYIDIKKCK